MKLCARVSFEEIEKRVSGTPVFLFGGWRGGGGGGTLIASVFPLAHYFVGKESQ